MLGERSRKSDINSDTHHGTKTDLGTIEPKGANTFTFTVALAADAPNDDQGKTANAVFQWDSTQLPSSTSSH